VLLAAVNDAEDAPAACKGRACESAVIPSSSRACTETTSSRALSSVATCSTSSPRGPAAVDCGKFRALADWVAPQLSPLEREVGALGVGL
jgi:hypothetical protein